MSYELLYPLLRKSGSTLSVEEFHENINIIFHNHEAKFYDVLHADMWESLQEQINLLIEDLAKVRTIENKLKLLDIGCGTGLSTQLLFQSNLGNCIQEVVLLDTSLEMLKQASEKAKLWNKKVKYHNGYLSEIKESFDVVIICSVLHHIPDLVKFLKDVENHLNSGGILIHLQDPNGDYLNDKEYLNRRAIYDTTRTKIKSTKKIADLIPKKWKRTINQYLGRKDYIDLINDELLNNNVITRRLTADEIWSVTDIHVETKTSSLNKGISLKFLQEQLFNFNLIKMRSYGFYGMLKCDLSDEFKIKEMELISESQVNGRNIAAIWIKK